MDEIKGFFTIEGHKISKDSVSGLLCDALEGGSNSWYVIREVHYPPGKQKEDFEFYHIQVPLYEGGELVIDVFDNEEQYSGKILNLESIQKGLKLLHDFKEYDHWGDFIRENDDAITGDVFLQLCLFGEIIFC